MSEDATRSEAESWDELSALHTTECDRTCEHDAAAHMNGCVFAEYQRNDPTWILDFSEVEAIAGGGEIPEFALRGGWIASEIRGECRRVVNFRSESAVASNGKVN